MSELLSPPPHTPSLRLSQTQKDLIGGSIGGIAQVLVGQPFDIIKVRIQTAPTGTYASPLDCATKLLKNDGPMGFYKGTLTPLLGIGACVSIQFGALEWSKRTFGAPDKDCVFLGELYASGAIAGVANTIVATPVEHIRIRLQTQSTFAGPLDCARQLYASAGIAGIMKGQVSTMWRDGLGYGSYFLVYEWLVQNHVEKHGVDRKDIAPIWSVTYGAAAGYGLWATIYPVDVIKSKLQTDSLDPTKRQYSGMIDCATKVWRAHGWRGFTGGLMPTLIRSPFANGATFVAFELAMRAMN
ncbi:mitochondrial carrier domain-containing protein [Naematelia encephala]|uniref:Mitochondrial carrier domain-containing protein n=1 Tax=Naematelia encephala TaxID=71784 RepID=A0A1Y2BL46_9TREE|nr:mitochondrial carrier domain-containing protein [Naematelia encephala]